MGVHSVTLTATAAVSAPPTPSQPPGSFDALYAAHRRDVYLWALRFGAGDTAWAEDLAHEVLLRLLQHLSELSRHEDLRGWLYRVTVNLALKQLRRDRWGLGRLRELLAEEPARGPDPHEALHLKRTAQRALTALRALPPKERVVMTMKLLEGLSQREIAAALDVTEGYVSKIVARATERLRRAPGGEP